MLLRFNAENKEIFNAIKSGIKKVETRAATTRYQGIKVGDTLSFVCDGETIKRIVSKVKHFKTVTALLKSYKPSDINPKLQSQKEIMEMYASFPGYEEKIHEFGILAFELK